MTSWKRWFTRSLSADPERLHFAAHSHHPWPDVTRDAHVRCWDDAARWLDDKWGPIFSEVLPAAKGHVARALGLSDPGRVTFAPNTHEFVVRLLSCLPRDRPVRVLTTDAEYHSFHRQVSRLAEDGRAEVRFVPSEPFADLPARLAAAAAEGGWDLVFFSHVLFSSGYVIEDPAAIVRAVPDPSTFVVVDGYHAFQAVPIDLAAIEDRAFYLGGGYKYAMAGEGACFLACPPGYGERPVNTGWMASFSAIADPRGAHRVPYAADGGRFFGATFDPSGLYRLNAVMDLLAREGVTVAAMADHVGALQERFLAALADRPHPEVRVEALMPEAGLPRGRFLTFRTARAGALQQALHDAGVITDHRGDRLRFGFGVYHDPSDVDALVERLARVRIG